MNPRVIIQQALKKVQAFKAYRCVMELESWENTKKRAKQLYLYRKPGDIRIVQLGPYQKGAVVVIRSDGKIRAHPGGVLSFFKVDLSRDSQYLTGLTGISALESDWLSIYRKTKQMAPYVIDSSCKAVRINGQRGYEVTSHLKQQPYDTVKIQIREDGPILRIERFKGNKLKTRVQWKDITVNPNLTDRDFSL